jgi:hypothetical protein
MPLTAIPQAVWIETRLNTLTCMHLAAGLRKPPLVCATSAGLRNLSWSAQPLLVCATAAFTLHKVRRFFIPTAECLLMTFRQRYGSV